MSAFAGSYYVYVTSSYILCLCHIIIIIILMSAFVGSYYVYVTSSYILCLCHIIIILMIAFAGSYYVYVTSSYILCLCHIIIIHTMSMSHHYYHDSHERVCRFDHPPQRLYVYYSVAVGPRLRLCYTGPAVSTRIHIRWQASRHGGSGPHETISRPSPRPCAQSSACSSATSPMTGTTTQR